DRGTGDDRLRRTAGSKVRPAGVGRAGRATICPLVVSPTGRPAGSLSCSTSERTMNFALLLFVLTAVTGAVWLVDRLVLEGRRRERARAATAAYDAQSRGSLRINEQALADAQKAREAKALREPGWVEYSKAFFPVLL